MKHATTMTAIVCTAMKVVLKDLLTDQKRGQTDPEPGM